MNFDIYGYLTPYEVIETDLETLRRVFVEEIASDTRPLIFEAYLEYLQELRNIVGTGFYQWIDGSFVTQKRNPRDIDFVTFVNTEVYRKKENELSILRHFWRTKRGIDAYLVEVYPTEHRNYTLCDTTSKEWLFWFSTTRKPSKNKGFIQLNF